MGCGAICGDSTAEQPKQITTALHIMQDLLPSLNKTSPLVSKQTFLTFIDEYRQDSKRFHLFPKAKLVKDQQISDEVLLRWKLILYGQDSDHKSYCSCLGFSQISQLQPSSDLIPLQLNIEPTIVYHECFSQIQKDLDRTFSLSGSRKKDFENVLKRIANFFPRMGYTQGINFVVGFLIILGYSENDTFWMFVHIALNRRFLLLGLYQDGFPLCNVFCIIFKNILKRTNETLYSHLFEVIMVDVSMWVFKWFMTCFIYSFPVEMIKYAWEIMIQLGGLGIVAFAVSISNEIGPHLLQKHDMCDLSQFLKSLSEIQSFNHCIDMAKVVKKVYEIEITPNDFAGSEETGGFYAVFFKQNCDLFQKHLKKSQGLPRFEQTSFRCQYRLDNWYNSLLQQRLKFNENHRTVIQLDLHLPIESHEKVPKISQDCQVDIKDEETDPAGVPAQENNAHCTLSRISSHDSHRYKISYHFQKINEHLEEDSKSAQSISSKKHSVKEHLSKKSSILEGASELEELDKLELQVYNKSKQGIKINNYASPGLVISSNKSNKRKEDREDSLSSKQPQDHKINMKSRNTFTVAGQNVLKIDNYDAISVSSKHNSQKDRRKTNQKLVVQVTGRICPFKTKTQQNKAFDRKSEAESSKGQFSDKDSLSHSISKENISHCQENPDLQSLSLQNVETYRENLPRAQTNDHYMICSHGPKVREIQSKEPIDQYQPRMEKMDIQVEVLPFKKDKKQRKGKISHIDIANGERSFRKNGIVEPSEESIESVPPFYLDRLSGVNSCKREGRCEACSGGGCEIQSIR